MKKLKSLGPIYFIITYLLIIVWLFKAVSTHFQFCLTSHSALNIIGLTASLFSLFTFLAYNNHEKGNIRALGIITLIIGILVLYVIVYRFFNGSILTCYSN